MLSPPAYARVLSCARLAIPRTVERWPNLRIHRRFARPRSSWCSAWSRRSSRRARSKRRLGAVWWSLPSTGAHPTTGTTIRTRSRSSVKSSRGMRGRIYGPYTGTHFDSRRQTDIEHMVAASEAHDSGLCSASLLFWAVCIAETFSDGVGVVEAQRKAVAVAPCPRRLPCSVRTDDHDQRWALHPVAAPDAASSGRWRMVPLGSCSTMQLPSLER